MNLVFFILNIIRCNSIVWRNSQLHPIKQVIYSSKLSFTKAYKHEQNALYNLPKGFVYFADGNNETITVTSIRKL